MTRMHTPRNKLIVARFCIMMHLIFTLVFFYELGQFLRSYANREGSDEPARLSKIVRALTPHIHIWKEEKRRCMPGFRVIAP